MFLTFTSSALGLLAPRHDPQVAENVALGFTPASVAVWGEEEVAVGGEDHKVYVYSLLDPAQPKATLEGPRGQVGAIRMRQLVL